MAEGGQRGEGVVLQVELGGVRVGLGSPLGVGIGGVAATLHPRQG